MKKWVKVLLGIGIGATLLGATLVKHWLCNWRSL